MTRRAPPRLARWLLSRMLPAGVRGDTIIGDLLEEFRARAGKGQPAARWYWGQALSLSCRYGARGRGRRPGACESPTGHDRRSLMRWRILIESVAADGRSAWRTLRQSPAFVVVAVTSIALGVGANTAIFTLVDQVVLRLLPVTRPQELVLLTSRGQQYGGGWGDGNELSYPMYEDLRDHNDVFTGMF